MSTRKWKKSEVEAKLALVSDAHRTSTIQHARFAILEAQTLELPRLPWQSFSVWVTALKGNIEGTDTAAALPPDGIKRSRGRPKLLESYTLSQCAEVIQKVAYNHKLGTTMLEYWDAGEMQLPTQSAEPFLRWSNQLSSLWHSLAINEFARKSESA
jgi:hypothetical protein